MSDVHFVHTVHTALPLRSFHFILKFKGIIVYEKLYPVNYN